LSRYYVFSCYHTAAISAECISSICNGCRGAFSLPDARRPDAKLGCTTSAARLTAESDNSGGERRFAEFVCLYTLYTRVPREKAKRRGPRWNSVIVGGARAYRVSSLINRVTGVDALHSCSYFQTSGRISQDYRGVIAHEGLDVAIFSLLMLKATYEKNS